VGLGTAHPFPRPTSQGVTCRAAEDTAPGCQAVVPLPPGRGRVSGRLSPPRGWFHPCEAARSPHPLPQALLGFVFSPASV
jgi:hypothetical protein